MKQRLITAGLASLAGGLAFTAGLHLHFPGEALVQRARFAVQDASGGKWALEAADASWWMLAGITLDDATLFKVDKPTRAQRRKSRAKADGAEDAADPLPKAVPFLRADAASVRLALLPLLTGRRQVDFDVSMYGGSIAGSVGEDAESRRIELDAADVDLARIPFEGESWAVDATGKLQLLADLQLATEGTADNAGTFRMQIDDLVIQNSRVMGMDLLGATFTQAVLAFELKGAKAEVTEGRFQADLLDVTVGGHVNVAGAEPDRWRLRLELQVTLDEKLDGMAKMVPDMKRARDDEGIYHFLCTGTVGRPVCREDRSKVRPSPSAALGAGGPPDGLDASADPEERRRARRDRVKERRERLREEREARKSGADDGPRELFEPGNGPGGRRLPGPGTRGPPPEFIGGPPDEEEFEDGPVGGPPFEEDLPPLDEPRDIPPVELGYVDE